MKLSYQIALLLSCLVYHTSTADAQDKIRQENYNLSLNADKIKIGKAIESVELIRFEETQQSLMSKIEMCVITEQGIVIPQRGIGKIHLFDKNGDYVNTIDRQGAGPEQYHGLSNVWFKDGYIELFSGTSRILQRFKQNGDYVKSIKVNFSESYIGGAMVPLESGYLYYTINKPGEKGADHSLIFTDGSLNEVSQALPAGKPHPFSFNLGKQLGKLNQDYWYKKNLTNQVFLIKNQQATPFMKLDFGRDWAWNNPKSLSSKKAAAETIYNGEKIYEILPDIGKDLITLTFYSQARKRKSEKGVIVRKTGEYYNFDLRKKNKENYNINFIQWDGDQLIASIDSSDAEEFIKSLKSEQWSIRGGYGIEEVLKSENPALLKINFKNQSTW